MLRRSLPFLIISSNKSPIITKLVVITGSANRFGIGANLVQKFLERDDTIVATCDCAAYNRDAVAAWTKVAAKKEEAFDKFGEALFVSSSCDITDETKVLQFFENTKEFFGGDQVLKNNISSYTLINNAAIANPYMQTEAPPEETNKEVDENYHHAAPISTLNTNLLAHYLNVNVIGPALMSKYFAKTLLPSGKKIDDASIINISSTRSVMSEPNSEGYCCSKSALEGLTRSTAITNSAMNAQRLRVNAVRLGWINCTPPPTPEEEKMPFSNNSNDENGGDDLQPKERDHVFHPVGRVGNVDDVFGVCEFLSDGKKSGFMTGSTLTVDGGVTKKMIYPEEDD